MERKEVTVGRSHPSNVYVTYFDIAGSRTPHTIYGTCIPDTWWPVIIHAIHRRRRAVFIQNWCFTHARRPRVNRAAAFPSTFRECRARRRRRVHRRVGRLPPNLTKATVSAVFLPPLAPLPLLRPHLGREGFQSADTPLVGSRGDRKKKRLPLTAKFNAYARVSRPCFNGLRAREIIQ